VEKAKNAGANYLLLRAFYNGTEDGGLEGDDDEAEKYLEEAIETAHDYGLSIFLTPFVESMEYWPEKKWTLDEEIWTEAVIKWARFAEDNDVEMFTPGFEMSIIFDDKEITAGWYKEILPQIREVYSGEVVVSEIVHDDIWKYLNERNAFAGYDGIGITVFPYHYYEGEHDMRSFDDFRVHVEGEASELDEVAEKYGMDFKFVATLGMDFWYGEMPSPAIRAEGFGIALDVLEEHGVNGVFLHLWASEHDQLGDSEDVENMLKKRWTVVYEKKY
jgi:sugar phosphate isomerase/epimerase